MKKAIRKFEESSIPDMLKKVRESEAKFEILRYLAELEEVSAKDLMKHVAQRINKVAERTLRNYIGSGW